MLDAVMLAFTSSPASTHSELRRAGAFTLILGAAWFAATFSLLIAQRVWQFLPNEGTFAVMVLGMPSIVIWCVGTHRLLWGQLREAPRLIRVLKTVASVAIGYFALALLSAAAGIVGALLVGASGHGQP